MDILEFSRTAYKSADAYLEHLIDSRKKGIKRISVRAVTDIDDYCFRWSLSEKVVYTDSVMVKIRSPLVPPELADDVKIMEYEETPPGVIVRVSPQMYPLIKDIPPEDITLESDLTFLVKAVKEWYRIYHDYIRPPERLPNMYTGMNWEERGLSEQQGLAIETALSSDISYIWGAPGTGKTQIVLANCILEYLRNDRKVLLMAPTNQALEQSVRGILHVFEQNNIPIHKLIRLGRASSQFANEFPEACEFRSFSKQIAEIKAEIAELTEQKHTQEKYTRLLGQRSRFEILEKQRTQLISLCNDLSGKIRDAEQAGDLSERTARSYRQALDFANREYGLLLAEKSSFRHKIKAMFSPKAERELEDKIRTITEQIDRLNDVLDRQTAVVSGHRSDLKALNEDLDRENSKLQSCVGAIQKLSKEAFSRKAEVESLAALFERELEKYVCAVDLSELDDRLHQKEEQLAELLAREADQYEDKNVIVCTVDYAILHYDRLLNGLSSYVRHIFVDEAAYCPMIKAGVFFSFGLPVTLLGDHMQLPPICEMDEKAIQSTHHPVCLWSQSALCFSEIFLENTDFETLFEQYRQNEAPTFENVATVFLTETYRFGNNLAAILDEFVYHSGFVGRMDKDTTITVINIPRSTQEEHPRASAGEADAIAEYVLSHHHTLKDYAILTPYKMQLSNISNRLKHVTDQIFTIHASQGREWDTVIVSVVDARNKFFMNSRCKESNGLRIINTAISRAKRELILVLDYDCWTKNPNEQLIGRLVQNHTEIVDNLN